MVWLAGWVLLGVCSSATPLQAERVAAGDPFAVPAGLRTQVEFWKRIFGEYSSRQVVIHDTLHLDRVYSVIDLRDLAEEGLSAVQSEVYQRELVAEEKERVRALLVRLHQVGGDADDLTPEARRIAQLFGTDAEPGEFLAAAAEDRVRAQAGLGERFAAGIEISRRYLPEMEATFRRAGLPVELTRLPFVESCFNVRAYSKAGAAGIWQFMPATARLYMRVDDVVDERRDPMVATRAAARHLRRDYEALGAWPLAVTAYNHGRAGITRAVAAVGSTDIVQIIRHYDGPAFKFASRNFYAEFLAALDVERNAARYFGTLRPQVPLRTESVFVPNPVPLRTLAQRADVAPDTLAALNPALAPDVVEGRLPVPSGYLLHVPGGVAAEVERRSANAMAAERSQLKPKTTAAATKTKASVGYLRHRVQRGQTLTGIARRYGTSVAVIKRHNRLGPSARVRTGQSLIIPRG